MTRIFQIMAIMFALALPAVCQSGQLSPQDQHEFDKAYAKWMNDTRRNDRDDIAKDARKMQDIMARYNIPPDVPFDRIASAANGQGEYNNYNNSQTYSQYGHSRLSPEDQRDFDRYYSQWMDDSRRNDTDDAQRDMRHMQDIMARHNIPQDVPFDQIATPAGDRNGYNENYARGPNSEGYSGYGQSRLSPDDQREFDKVYAKWMHDQRHDRDDVKRDERKMQDIMARYNIPQDVPFDRIASPNAGYRH